MRILHPAEAAYVGALLDSEGTISQPALKRALLYIDNSEPEIISALLRAVGAGEVYGYQPTNGTRLMLKWALMRQADVVTLSRQLAPYSLKAQRALLIAEDRFTLVQQHLHPTCADCGRGVAYQGPKRQSRRCNGCAATERWRQAT